MYKRRMAGFRLQASALTPARVTTKMRANVYTDELMQEKFKTPINLKAAGKEIKKMKTRG